MSLSLRTPVGPLGGVRSAGVARPRRSTGVCRSGTDSRRLIPGRTTTTTKSFVGRLAMVAMVALPAMTASATLVFTEDFTGLADGTDITTSNTDLTYVRIGTGGGVIDALDPGSFGTGPSAIITQNTSSGSLAGVGVRSTLPSSNVYTLTLDLRLTNLTGDVVIGVGAGTSFTGDSTFSTSHGLFWLQSDSGNFERRTSSAWVDVGGSTSLALNTNYALRVVANGSSSPLTYPGGSLAANTMDIYLDGSLIDNDVPVTTNGLSANGFRMYQVNLGNFEVDNIQLYTAAVPEPATLGLATVGVTLAGLGGWKRRRSAWAVQAG